MKREDWEGPPPPKTIRLKVADELEALAKRNREREGRFVTDDQRQ